jgi:hypothetical protein
MKARYTKAFSTNRKARQSLYINIAYISPPTFAQTRFDELIHASMVHSPFKHEASLDEPGRRPQQRSQALVPGGCGQKQGALQ